MIKKIREAFLCVIPLAKDTILVITAVKEIRVKLELKETLIAEQLSDR